MFVQILKTRNKNFFRKNNNDNIIYFDSIFILKRLYFK